MKWTEAAEERIKKVPFFIRKKVRAKVEDHVRASGDSLVEAAAMDALKKQYLSKGGMAKDMKGYDVSVCMGGDQCPNKAVDCTALANDIERLLEKADLLTFLKNHVQGDLKFHHAFKVSISGCPNACSRPQIVDIGIIGVAKPVCTGVACTHCNACVGVCKENAVSLSDEAVQPVFNEHCLFCGRCAAVCPTGTIDIQKTGYVVMLGGRLGRHPRLGMTIPGILSDQQVLDVVEHAIVFYKSKSVKGERFAHLLESTDQVYRLAPVS